jgi:hypothetical protein
MGEVVSFPSPPGAEARLFDNWVREKSLTTRLNIDYNGVYVGANVIKGVSLWDALREIIKQHEAVEASVAKNNIDSGTKKTSIEEFLS